MPYDMQPRSEYPYTPEKARALSAFRNHRLTIERDDGVFRSLFFGAPNTGNYHFRLNTWPGHLCISGDIGTYVFSRTYDMFQFHATADDWASMPIEINPHYWAEKLQTGGDSRRSVQNHYIDVPHIVQNVVEAFRQIPRHEFAKWPARRHAFEDLRHEVIDSLSEDDSAEYVAGMLDRYTVPDSYLNEYKDISLVDGTSWEWGLTRSEYKYGFLICCYAVVWGIKSYAQQTKGRDQASHDKAILAGTI